MNTTPRATLPPAARWLPLTIVSAALIAFSQTGAIYDGDEGLHLVAALAVKDGQRPYVDFFYWHQPLYLYLAASWMAVVGESWRSVHALSAVLTAACAVLVGTVGTGAGQTETRRTWSGVVGASFFGLNVLVLKWGTIGHNYALCLLLSVAALALVIRTVRQPGVWGAFWTGFFAGAATATSLLVVPLAPILLIWLVLNNTAGDWRAKSVCFMGAAVIPFLPVIWLAIEAPYPTFFGLVAHHLFYRAAIDNATTLQWEILLSWSKSPQALMLILLSAIGLWFAARAPHSDKAARNHFYLCASLVIAMGVFVTVIHPPARTPYFVLTTPFLAMLAAAGTDALAQRVRPARPSWLVALVVGFFILSGVGSIYRERSWVSEWARVESFAEAVNRVTPADASFYTSYAFVYFAARHRPPPGLENGWASHMPLSADLLSSLRVMPASVASEKVRSGGFDTTLLWRDDPRFDRVTLERVYRQARDLDRYFVLRWDVKNSERVQW